MKYLYPVILVIFLGSCASVQKDSGIDESVKAEESADRSEADQEAVTATTEAEAAEETALPKVIYLLTKTLTFFDDGFLGEYVSFSYDESSNNLLKEALYTANDELIEYITYEYQGDYLSKKSTFDSAGNLKSYHTYSFSAGNLEKDTLYDNKETVQTVSMYDYDAAGHKLKWSIYDGSGGLLAYTNYLYSEGKNIGIEIFSAAGKLDEVVEIEYNDITEKIKEIYRSASGKLNRYNEFEYKNGFLVSETHYSDARKVNRRYDYSYDPAGNMIESVLFDHNQNIKETKEYQYLKQ